MAPFRAPIIKSNLALIPIRAPKIKSNLALIPMIARLPLALYKPVFATYFIMRMAEVCSIMKMGAIFN